MPEKKYSESDVKIMLNTCLNMGYSYCRFQAGTYYHEAVLAIEETIYNAKNKIPDSLKDQNILDAIEGLEKVVRGKSIYSKG